RKRSPGQFLSAGRNRILLPPCNAVDDIAGFEFRIVRTFDNTDRAAAHYVAELDRRHVLLHVAHPDAIGRIQRQIEGARQDFAGARVRDWRLDKLEVAGLDLADGPSFQNPLPVAIPHCTAPEARNTVAYASRFGERAGDTGLAAL